MSAQNIKAGQAFVEVIAKDKMGAGLARAQAKLAVFARTVKTMSTALAGGLRAIGHGLTFIGTAVAAAGASVLAALGASVKTFLDVSRRAKETGKAIAGIDPKKAERLSGAIKTLSAVWGAIQFRAAEAIAEPLTNVLAVLIKVGALVADWIKKNQGLVVTIAAVAAVAVLAGGAIAALGAMFILAASAVAGIAAILTAVATPVGLAVALIAALAAAVLLAAGAFAIMAEMSTGSVSGLLAAIATGDILKAWGIITQGMTTAWQAAMFVITKAMDDMIKGLARRFDNFIQGFVTRLKSVEAATGLSLGAGTLGALSAGTAAAVGAGADGNTASAAGGLASSLAELARLNQEARDNFMRGFAGVSFNLPDLGKLINSGNRQNFGVTGSTNSAAAGQNRAMGSILAEEKKSNEHLDNILKVLKDMKVEGGLEFAP